MHIVPLWPGVWQECAASFGMDTRPAMPGTVPGSRMWVGGEVPTA